jgi:acylphosphatase
VGNIRGSGLIYLVDTPRCFNPNDLGAQKSPCPRDAEDTEIAMLGITGVDLQECSSQDIESSDCFFMNSSEKPITARRFLVRGRVQGVGFRWFVEREAHTLGIAGWVRNNSDSSVEVLAIGTADQLFALRSRLQQGPRAARVDNVDESEAKPVPGLTKFRIEGAW